MTTNVPRIQRQKIVRIILLTVFRLIIFTKDIELERISEIFEVDVFAENSQKRKKKALSEQIAKMKIENKKQSWIILLITKLS